MFSSEVFFSEWRSRTPDERRSLVRARRLAESLDLVPPPAPVLAVVGSKGKGTAAAYASARLAGSGLRVVTITSPGLRSNRERIRLGGAAISAAELSALEERLAGAIDRIGPRRPGGGYLSPGGLFTLAGVLHARTASADVIVLEAGRGGRSDEASLFPATVVAVTPIFEEHLGTLGSGVTEIARDKIGIVADGTRAVISAPQRGAARAVIGPRAENIAQAAAGLHATNAEVGRAAADRLLKILGRAPGGEPPVVLPGRLSVHASPGASGRLLIDAAISRDAVAAALAAARRLFGAPPDHVLLSLPDDKDLDGAIDQLDRLAGLPVTFVRLARPYLSYGRAVPWPVVMEDRVDRSFLTGLGHDILCLGTISFVGLLLDLLDVDTERLWRT